MTTPPPASGAYPPPPPGGYPPPGHGYPAGFGGYGYPPPRTTNTMAILALVCAFVFAPLGIVFGHLSLSQIKKTGEDGRALAIAGLIIGYLLTVLTTVVVVISIVFVTIVARDPESRDGLVAGPGTTATPNATLDELPAFDPPATGGSNCRYPATTEPPSKPATPPRSGRVPTDPELVGASMRTNQGNIGLQLDNAKTPCTVNNFASLAQQGFYDDTPCHRLTTGDLAVLQCGDPTGSGTGGPGYRFPNEYPTNQYRLSDPAMRSPVRYPRGTLAMANAGPGTNGSQFFMIYEDSELPPTYTVFGSIDPTGLATLDKIAAEGVADGSEDGKPAADVRIESVRLD